MSLPASREEGIAKFQELLKSTDWEEVGEEKGIKIARRNAGEIYSFRGEGIVKAPAELVYDTLRREDLKPNELSELRLESRTLERIDDKTLVRYVLMNSGSFIVSNRDYSIMIADEELPDGSYLEAMWNYEHPACPPTKGVRAWVGLSGWFMEPVDATSSRVVYIACMDPKGMIPSPVVTMVGKKTPMCIDRIRKFLEK